MVEIHTRRAQDNFDYDRLSSAGSIDDNGNVYRQNQGMFYLKSNDDQLQSSLTPSFENSYSSQHRPEFYHLKVEDNDTEYSNYPSSPVPYHSSSERKPEMYYLTVESGETQSNDIPQQPKLNGIMKHPPSPYRKKITTYMIAASNGDDFPAYIPRTPSPSENPNKKKHVVTFSAVDNDDMLNQQRHAPLSKSKASESIQRSMNIYRLRES